MTDEIQRVGVIGGGQLAWMMALGAQKLGLSLMIQTPQASDPAWSIATATVLAPVEDAAATAALAQYCDVITFENEFIDLPALQILEAGGVLFRPSLGAIAPLLDKYTQRQFLVEHHFPNPQFIAFEAGAAPMGLSLDRLGWPLVLKTRRLGYDGQGTFILKDFDQFQTIWADIGKPGILLEEFVPFEKELAVMVARSPDGTVAVYPVVETQQQNQVCRRVFAPAAVSTATHRTVQDLGRALIEALDFVGVLGIELFLAGDRVLVNEVAPRTHNSGHYTLDAVVTSQFEQQLRAVAGLPLGPVTMTCDRAVMVNLLGFETAKSDYATQRDRLAQLPNSNVYWYGKGEARPGRKLGHVTVCLGAGEEPAAIAAQVEALWYPPL